MDTILAKRMIERADADGLPDDHKVRTTAAEFEEGAKLFFSGDKSIDAKKFMGRYARAKLCWTEYSGEPLI